MNVETTASFHRGFWFFFEFEGHQITFHASALSGRERVFVDDDVVIDCHSLRFSSSYPISVAGKALNLSFSLEDIWKGIGVCELSRYGRTVARARVQLTGGALMALGAFLAGTASGALGVALMYALGVL